MSFLGRSKTRSQKRSPSLGLLPLSDSASTPIPSIPPSNSFPSSSVFHTTTPSSSSSSSSSTESTSPTRPPLFNGKTSPPPTEAERECEDGSPQPLLEEHSSQKASEEILKKFLCFFQDEWYYAHAILWAINTLSTNASSKVAWEKFPKALVNIALASQAEPPPMYGVLEGAVSYSLRQISHSELLFRVDCIVTRLIKEWTISLCEQFVLTLLGRSLTKWMQKPLDKPALEHCTQKVLDLLFQSKDQWPPEFSTGCSLISAQIAKKFPGAEQSALAGIIFLRFLCPLIIKFSSYTAASKSSANFSQNLLGCAKRIQSLANGEINTVDPKSVLTEANRAKMLEFFAAVSSPSPALFRARHEQNITAIQDAFEALSSCSFGVRQKLKFLLGEQKEEQAKALLRWADFSLSISTLVQKKALLSESPSSSHSSSSSSSRPSFGSSYVSVRCVNTFSSPQVLDLRNIKGNVLAWNTEQVVGWLEDNELLELVPVFRARQINGPMLFSLDQNSILADQKLGVKKRFIKCHAKLLSALQDPFQDTLFVNPEDQVVALKELVVRLLEYYDPAAQTKESSN